MWVCCRPAFHPEASLYVISLTRMAMALVSKSLWWPGYFSYTSLSWFVKAWDVQNLTLSCLQHAPPPGFPHCHKHTMPTCSSHKTGDLVPPSPNLQTNQSPRLVNSFTQTSPSSAHFSPPPCHPWSKSPASLTWASATASCMTSHFLLFSSPFSTQQIETLFFPEMFQAQKQLKSKIMNTRPALSSNGASQRSFLKK